MAHDTLEALLRIRRLAVEEAMRNVAASLQEASQARRALAALTEAIARERAIARDLMPADPRLAAFGPWQARTRQDIAHAAARLDHADRAIAAAQAALGEARGAARAMEAALERRRAEENAAAWRRAQHELEDVARRAPGAV